MREGGDGGRREGCRVMKSGVKTAEGGERKGRRQGNNKERKKKGYYYYFHLCYSTFREMFRPVGVSRVLQHRNRSDPSSLRALAPALLELYPATSDLVAFMFTSPGGPVVGPAS